MIFAVFDRNYVAFQALLGSCADNYRALKDILVAYADR